MVVAWVPRCVMAIRRYSEVGLARQRAGCLPIHFIYAGRAAKCTRTVAPLVKVPKDASHPGPDRGYGDRSVREVGGDEA